MPNNIRSYAELAKLIRSSLRAQHPEWIEPNGASPICDEYEKRLATLLGLTYSAESDSAKAKSTETYDYVT